MPARMSNSLREYLACKEVAEGVDGLVRARLYHAGAGATRGQADGAALVDAALVALTVSVDGAIRTYTERPTMSHNYDLREKPAEYVAEPKGPKRQYPYKLTINGRPSAFAVERHRRSQPFTIKAFYVVNALERALSNKQRRANVVGTDGQVTVYVEPPPNAVDQRPHFTREGAVLSDGRFVSWPNLRDALALMLDKDEQLELPLVENEVLSRDVDEPIRWALEVVRRFARLHGAE